MAQIPIGNFGQSVARAAPMPSVQQGDPINAAVGGVLNQGAVIIGEQQAEAERVKVQGERARAALALAKTGNDLHSVHDEVARGVIDGVIEPGKAAAEYQKRATKIADENLTGFSADQRMQMDAHVIGVSGSLERSLGGVVQKRQQMDVAGTIDQFGEQVSREAARKGPEWAVQKFGAMVDFTGDAAGMNPEQKAKLKQQFAERATATFFTTAATGALTRGDAAALRKLQEDIGGPGGDALDPQKRATLTHQIFGWEQHVLAQKDRAANQAAEAQRLRFNDAVEVYNKATDVAMSGGYFSPDFITEMVTKAGGTDMQPAVVNLIASQRQVAGFASKPAAERGAILERMRAARATPGVGTDPVDDKLLNAAEAMDGKLRAAADANPWEAAQKAGAIADAPLISAADPAGAINILRQRMAGIGAVENWTGRKVSPLQPQEAEQVAKMVRQMPLDQAATMLSSFGAAMGDADRAGQLAKQLHDKDGAVGLAMLYANAQTTQGRAVAELVLRGDQAIKDKAVMLDRAAETGWQGTISKAIRGAYSNREAEDAYVDAAFKIAAAKYAQNGSADIPEAVKLATGGIVERNGVKFPLPWGMKEGDFEKRIEAMKPADLAAQVPGDVVRLGSASMSLADFVAALPKATLVHAGQGLYNVRAGTALATNAAGQRITIKVAP